jgi:hypothetical protein
MDIATVLKSGCTVSNHDKRRIMDFIHFHGKNNDFYHWMVNRCFAERNANRTHFGVAWLFEEARYYSKFVVKTGQFKLSSSNRTFYARLLEAQFPIQEVRLDCGPG